MTAEYQVGDLSVLLQSATPPTKKKKVAEKLQTLFSPKSQLSTIREDDTDDSKPKVKKKKDKREKKMSVVTETEETEHTKQDTKKRKHEDHFALDETSEELNTSDTLKKKKKLSKNLLESPKADGSPGFNPPAGIVHETLVSKQKMGKKRKIGPSSDSEEETLSKEGRAKKSLTRKRRDRLAKATDKRTIFVGNLPITVKKKKLLAIMKEYGEIESIRYRCFAPNDPNVPKRVVAIKQKLHPDRHNCVAYVCFKAPEAAKKALKSNGREIDGLHIRVDMAARDQVRDIKKSIFVGNLSFGIEEEAVRKHFEDCGTIENVRIVRDSKTSLGKGFCFVNFTDTDAVTFAARLNGSTLEGREIRVMQCQQNPTKSVVDRNKTPDKKQRKMKKGFTPSNQGPRPFHGEQAVKKTWTKSKPIKKEYKLKKTKFEETFEKVRMERMTKTKHPGRVHEKGITEDSKKTSVQKNDSLKKKLEHKFSGFSNTPEKPLNINKHMSKENKLKNVDKSVPKLSAKNTNRPVFNKFDKGKAKLDKSKTFESPSAKNTGFIASDRANTFNKPSGRTWKSPHFRSTGFNASYNRKTFENKNVSGGQIFKSQAARHKIVNDSDNPKFKSKRNFESNERFQSPKQPSVVGKTGQAKPKHIYFD